MNQRNAISAPAAANQAIATQVLQCESDGGLAVVFGSESLEQISSIIYDGLEGGGFLLAKWLLMHAANGTLPQPGSTITLPSLDRLDAESACASDDIVQKARKMFPDGFSGGHRMGLRTATHRQKQALQGQGMGAGLQNPTLGKHSAALASRRAQKVQVASKPQPPRVALAHALRQELQARTSKTAGRPAAQVADLMSPKNIAAALVKRIDAGNVARTMTAFAHRQEFQSFVQAQALTLVGGDKSTAWAIASYAADSFEGALKQSALFQPVRAAINRHIDHGSVFVKSLAHNQEVRDHFIQQLWTMPRPGAESLLRAVHLEHLIDLDTLRNKGPDGFSRQLQQQAEAILTSLKDIRNTASRNSLELLKLAPPVAAKAIDWQKVGFDADVGLHPYSHTAQNYGQEVLLSTYKEVVNHPNFWPSLWQNLTRVKSVFTIAMNMAFPPTALVVLVDGVLPHVDQYQRTVALHAAQVMAPEEINAAVLHGMIDVAASLLVQGGAAVAGRALGKLTEVGGKELSNRLVTKGALIASLAVAKAAGKTAARVAAKPLSKALQEEIVKHAAHRGINDYANSSYGKVASITDPSDAVDDDELDTMQPNHPAMQQYLAQLMLGKLALDNVYGARATLNRAHEQSQPRSETHSKEQLIDLFCLTLGPHIPRLATDGSLAQVAAAFFKEFNDLQD